MIGKTEIVLGPPGTGKTTRLLSMVDDELGRGVPPDRIGYVSFTKRAAQEAIERACEKFGLEREQLRYFRTLHSMCFNALGISNGDVFEGKKLIEFGDWIGVKLSEMRVSDDGTMAGFTSGDRALFMENLARVRGVSLREQYELGHDGLQWSFVDRVSRALEQFKRDRQLLDYTDMLVDFARQDWSPALEVLFVDEAQDLSALQWRVVEKLSRGCRRVVIAGDDDQAIYRWAGADVEHLIGLEGDVSVLGQSWRCPISVQELSQEMIGRVRNRRPKEWRPRDARGSLDRVRRFEDVDTSGKDVLILGRNAFTLRNLMPSLRSDGVIYEWKGHSSVSQKILEAVRSWEKLRRGEKITADEARLAYEYLQSGPGVRRGYKSLPGFGSSEMVDISILRERGGLMRDEIWHEALTRIPAEERTYMLRARQKGESLMPGKARVRLSTIHGAKGGEADHVVLLSDMATRTYAEFLANPEDEARVFYVAVTRSRDRLTVVAPSMRTAYDV